MPPKKLKSVDSNLSEVNFDFECVKENKENEKWLEHWDSVWPHCEAWYLSEGLLRRPGYHTCLSALKSYMPEIVPVFSKLAESTGGSDIASRFLSLYNPPPYMAGCSQIIWNQNDPSLIRNYDYSADLFERTLFYSNWLRPVIGMLDCAWGLLDGMNESGLIASLTFGGRKEVGQGFGAPLILRYLLETSNSVAEAKLKIAQIPCHMSYNVMLLDQTGAYTKVYLSPGLPAVFVDDKVSTNHQQNVEWLEYAEFSGTIERYNFLQKTLASADVSTDKIVQAFLNEPLFNTNFSQQFGTLYTVIYRPQQLNLSLLWHQQQIHQSFQNFEASKINLTIKDLNL